MVFSKRERIAAILAGSVVGVLVLDRLVITPLIEQQAQVRADIASAQDQADDADRLFAKQRSLTRKWATIAGQSMPRDGSIAESLLLNGVRDFALEAGLTLSSVKPDRAERENDFYKITVRATAVGEMRQIGQFMYRLENAKFPVRISDLVIGTRKEGTDDLTLSIGVSTIFPVPDSDKSKGPNGNGNGNTTVSSAWEK